MPATLPIDDFIKACYRVLLLRDPEDAGLREHALMFEAGSVTPEQFMRAMLRSAEFQALAPHVFDTYVPQTGRRFTNDHSQYGEVEILLRLWVNGSARHRIVVDIGARGKKRSNSYDLLKVFGWRGLLVEANPDLLDSILAEFAGLNFELLHVAISDYDGSATFHISANDDVSSLDETACASWGTIKSAVSVDVRRLEPTLRQHNIPDDFDLLSLDIEGEDIKVLNDLVDNSTYRPRWVIIEASYDYATKTLASLPVSEKVRSSYDVVGQTAANLILKARI